MGKKVLVIDDDPAVRGAFQLVLSDAGCTVREADNGLAGVELAQAERPDVIFLDLKMPGVDGVETLRRLKAVDATLNIYIVTAFSNEYIDQLKLVHDEGYQFQLASKPLSSSQIRDLARIADQSTQPDQQDHEIELTLYVVSMNEEARKMAEQITLMLTNTYEPGRWAFHVVEVLSMPEKALKNEVFATPMLVRDLPQPVLKMLGDLSRMAAVMAAITTRYTSDETHTIIV